MQLIVKQLNLENIIDIYVKPALSVQEPYSSFFYDISILQVGDVTIALHFEGQSLV